MEDELGKVKQLKKIPNDEVQRILADLGHDVCLDKSSMKNSETKGAKNHNTSITMASPSGSLDPSGSKCMKQAEEDDLELDLADFLGQIYRYHDEWPHDDCKNKSELCPKLKSLIHAKLNELNNPPCDLAYEQTPESEGKELVDDKHLCNSRADHQSKKLTDALDMLSLDNELFLKIRQKTNSHILENIQRHQNKHVGTKLEPRKMLGKYGIVEDTKSSNQHELPIKTQNKESRHIFFWKKDKSNRSNTSEGTNSFQPVNKIVILKPNPRRWIDPAVATTSTSVQQQSCTIQAPEYSATENSKFSIKEVRRRFRLVTGETRIERPSVHEGDLQRWPKDSTFTIKRESRQDHEQTSGQKASATTKNDLRPSNSSKQKQRNDGLGEINSNIITSKDAFIFYEEAKKHLTEILQDKNQTAKYPTVQVSRSLVGMLSLPQCSTPSPRSSPRVEDCIDLSPEEKNICARHKAEREESAKERSKSEEDSGSVACATSEALDEKAVQERHFMKEEATQHGEYRIQ